MGWRASQCRGIDLGSGTAGLTGSISSSNSILGGIAGSISNSVFAYNSTHDYLAAGLYSENKVVIKSLAAVSNTITTGAITGSPFCAGASVTVPFTATGTYNPGNVFKAELSDASGVFLATPNVIGTLAATTGTSITGHYPRQHSRWHWLSHPRGSYRPRYHRYRQWQQPDCQCTCLPSQPAAIRQYVPVPHQPAFPTLAHQQP